MDFFFALFSVLENYWIFGISPTSFVLALDILNCGVLSSEIFFIYILNSKSGITLDLGGIFNLSRAEKRTIL